MRASTADVAVGRTAPQPTGAVIAHRGLLWGVTLSQGFQQGCRWRKEQAAGDRAAEIQQAIIIAGWPTNKHVLQHLLDGLRGTRVADEVSAELPHAGFAERHIVTQYFDFIAVFIGQRRQGTVG